RDDAAASVLFESAHHFVRIHVAGDAVEVAVVRLDGELIDSFSFGARPAGVCRGDADCAGLAHPACAGAWRCVGQACDYRCGPAAAPVAGLAEAAALLPSASADHGAVNRRRAFWLAVLGLSCAGGALLLRRRKA
ncbi:MAG TPA: hypothetical protein VGQ83_21835, partial [Polyangia bacterium]